MKRILFVLFFAVQFASAQSYVKVADKAEYSKYLAYCNTRITKTVYQHGIYKVMKVNGQYSDSLGNYTAVNPVKIVWTAGTTTPEGRNSITVAENERCVSISIKIVTIQRPPSIPDFYANWITHKIPQ
jgi:hypothetical protein